MPEKFKNSNQFNWLLKMALRDGKASAGKLSLFIASIVLGIAAVVSIQSFGENLRDNIALQSKSLMGADYIIDSDKPMNDRVLEIIDSLGGADSREISFSSMALFPKNGRTKLMNVRGISGGFPFYGEIETENNSDTNFEERNAALVDATTMLQLGISEGDSIKFGNVTLPVLARLKAIPGSSSLFSSIAPPVIVPLSAVQESGLIQTGSRIDYKYYFKADANEDMDLLDKELDPILDAEDADLDTHKSTSERLGRRYENFGRFLNLVAFVALLLGCIGIASSIHIYIKGKLRSVAVLKCLGASRKQTFLIYLIQIAIIGFFGGIAGTALGLVLQQTFPLILSDLLPIEVQISFVPGAIIMGIILGLVMSVLFALYSLIGTFYVSPLQTLRVQENESGISRKAGLIILLLIFIFILGFSYWLLKDWQHSFSFVGGVIITFGILAGVSRLFILMIKKFFPKNSGFIARQSLLNLFRPNNQTLILVLAIGLGTFLMSTLYFTRDMLLAEASLDQQANSPNLILLDVQSDQANEVANTVKNQGLPVLENIPIATMRVSELQGRSAQDLKNDSTSTINGWILNHEFRTTYRDSLISSEELIAGDWVSNFDPDGMVPISVSEDFSKDAEVTTGDTINFNVQGVIMETRVASIRKVDWSRMQLNFSIVFPQGILEDAPQFRILTTKANAEGDSAELQQKLVSKFPNISVIDLRQVLTVIEDILGKIGWLINFMAFFSIITGVIVLIGAVRTSKYQRIKESVLLRTLGAKGSQIYKIVALEYLYLGLLGSLTGILLSLLSTALLAWFLFESIFVPSLIPFLIILPAISILVLLIGLSNSVAVVKSPPLQILRKQAL